MKKVGKIGLAFAVITVAIPLAGFALLQTARLALCRTDDAERVTMPGNEWIVVTRIHNCGVPDPGSMTIVAENRQTHEEIILFKVDAEAMSQTTLVGDGIVELVPDDVRVTQAAARFGDFNASFRQVPESSLRIPQISN